MFVSPVQTPRTQITAHLAQTMSFLAMSNLELEGTLARELNYNPALELVDELRCPNCGRRLRHWPCAHCVAPRQDQAAVVYVSPRTWSSGLVRDDEDAEPREPGCPERLDEFVLRQIGPALSADERPIAVYILARLDEDGFLPEDNRDIASYLHVPVDAVERVLALIQDADPPGVGARSPAEALLLQLRSLEGIAPGSVGMLAAPIIEQHFDLLARHDFAGIARRMRLPRTAIEAAARFIGRNLTPYPVRAYWGEGKHAGTAEVKAAHSLDVAISLLNRLADGPLMVEIYSPLAGWLRINPDFKAALADCSEAEREKWSPAVERAGLVAKCIQQRNHTMCQLMETIAAEQRDFILGGDVDLKPLTRAQVARTIGVHESTISRAVAGKSAALPDGRIVALAKFFDRSLSVRDRVRTLIEAETRPLTDDDIAAALRRQGIQVARRTVAKYRNMLGILPANVRARLNRAPHPALRRPPLLLAA